MPRKTLLKALTLVAAMMAGATLNVSCGLGDMRDSMVTGLLTYVKTSTSDALTGLLPSWKECGKATAGT